MARKTQHQFQRVLYILIVVGLSFAIVTPFIIPILLAATLALAMYPLQLRLQKRNWTKGHAAALITTIFTVTISLPFIFFVTKGTLLVVEQLERFSLGQKIEDQGMEKVVNTLQHDIVAGAHKYMTKVPMAEFLTEDKLNGYMKAGSGYLIGFFQSLAMSIPTMLLFLIVMILCLYGFLSGAGTVRNFFQELFGFSDRKMDQLVGIFLKDSREVYISNILTGAIQSIIVATAVFFTVDSDWFLVFFVTLIFSFVPVIGAAPMAFLFAVVCFFQGNTTGAVILTVVSGFTGIVDNILRPWLASFGESKVPGIVSFVFVIGGALWLGFPGLFIGLLMGALAWDTLPLFWEEISKTESGPAKNLSGFFSFGDKSKDEGDSAKH